MELQMTSKSAKVRKLKKILGDMRRVIVAFSGGLDSTFLLKIALNTVGKDNVLAVTARSETFPAREYNSAKDLARRLKANFITINTKELKNREFRANPVDRCYHCKKELFGRLVKMAEEKDFTSVIDGFNHDDKKDMRYGSRAARELGVRSPLAEARIGKDEIRVFSRQLRLPTWNKPPFACLASRIPYSNEITKKELKRIDRAESFLQRCGFRLLRVRAHDNIARIELSLNDFKRLALDQKLKKNVVTKLRQIGFTYIALDLEGYRTGSMNEILNK